ncbi:hypothetical protein HS7_20320 [Sulfolobales archaeon HS-7]|nr:hypothetical protein HS7_20320 [Sulfolobales archaeon HS-7]
MVEEIEGKAPEEAEDIIPKYAREKKVKRKWYSSFRFLKGFVLLMKGRRKIFNILRQREITCLLQEGRGSRRVRRRNWSMRVRQSSRSSSYSCIGGKLNAKLLMLTLDVKGDFKYVHR